MSALDESAKRLTCRVNGREVCIGLPSEGISLLDLLRNELGITSPKDGCQPQAQCGCCTVLVDGKPVLSCAIQAERVEGKSVTTLEGVSEGYRQLLAESFVRCGGVQCGFCIPGFAIRAFALCEKETHPTRQQITDAIKPHLCRCTGYQQIVDSIETYSKVRRGEPWPAASASDESGKVGTNLARYTGHDAVLGDRPFVDDMAAPGMLYGASPVFRPSPCDRAFHRPDGCTRRAGCPPRRHGGGRAGRKVRWIDRNGLAHHGRRR